MLILKGHPGPEISSSDDAFSLTRRKCEPPFPHEKKIRLLIQVPGQFATYPGSWPAWAVTHSSNQMHGRFSMLHLGICRPNTLHFCCLLALGLLHLHSSYKGHNHNMPRIGRLQQQEFVFSQFQKLEVWEWGAGRVVPMWHLCPSL